MRAVVRTVPTFAGTPYHRRTVLPHLMLPPSPAAAFRSLKQARRERTYRSSGFYFTATPVWILPPWGLCCGSTCIGGSPLCFLLR